MAKKPHSRVQKHEFPPRIATVPCRVTIIDESLQGSPLSFSESISPLLGRCILGWFYGSAALNILNHWSGLVSQLAARHVPQPSLMLAAALILTVAGCLSLLLGYHARCGAITLFGLTIAAAVTLHDFWHDAGLRAVQYEIFARDVAIGGGLLLMVGLGSGPYSLDNRGKAGR